MARAASQTRLTVVTSVLDAEPFIAETLASLPRSPAVEHLVIDAGSRDGTLERLRSLPGILLLECPGLPLYEAWNLAVEQGSGDAFLFLNGDDCLAKGAIDVVLAALDEAPDAEMVQGGATAFGEVRVGGRRGRTLVYPPPGPALDLLQLTVGAPVINAKVVRRRLFDRLGSFEPSFQHAADREFLLRAALAPEPPICQTLDRVIYRYRIHSGSMTLSQSPGRRAEIARQHCEIAAKFLSNPHLEPFARRYLRAWQARERAVEALSRLRTEGPAGGFGPALAMLGGLPRLPVDLQRARRLRRTYIQSCGVPDDPVANVQS